MAVVVARCCCPEGGAKAEAEAVKRVATVAIDNFMVGWWDGDLFGRNYISDGLMEGKT